jgi:hypothetical protein
LNGRIVLFKEKSVRTRKTNRGTFICRKTGKALNSIGGNVKKLESQYIFPLSMTSFICSIGEPPPATQSSYKIVEALVYEEGSLISISHPSFKFKNQLLYPQYLVDAQCWYRCDDKAVLLIHCFVQIIKKNHGEFEVCCHKDSEKWETLHNQSMADILDYRECLLHMIDRLGLWEGVFGDKLEIGSRL